jgi:hypothetical protein
MKRGKILLSIALLYLSIAVISIYCGGGGGSSNNNPNPNPNPTGLTTFAGGTVADLKALSPNLVFDELEITGGVVLPDASQYSVLTTITANKLTITPTGGFRYNWHGGSYANAPDDCKWVPAPSLTLIVSGDVMIDGNISLEGRKGVTINSIYEPCKWCDGMNGGNLTITGNTITIKGELWNIGGDGALTTDFGNHCGSGDSGSLKLAAATTMDLSGAKIHNNAGAGMDASKNGSSGTVYISAGGAFTMRDGNIDSTGAMAFSAASTDIWGSILYGSLNETIGGVKDTTNPTISVLSSSITATYTENAVVTVQASDLGMGLRGVRLQGLGNDRTYDIADCGPGSALCTASALDSTITVTAFEVKSDTTTSLQVTAIDNKGNTTMAPPVTGILIAYPAEKEPNDSIAQAEALPLHGVVDGNIQTGDAGSTWSGLFVEDFYKVKCCTSWTLPSSSLVNCVGGTNAYHNWCDITCWGFIIDVDFSGSASVSPDIDVYLLDYMYRGVGSSTNRNVSLNKYTEHIQSALYEGRCVADNWVPSLIGTEYIVGVRAWNVPTRANYRIKYDH